MKASGFDLNGSDSLFSSSSSSSSSLLIIPSDDALDTHEHGHGSSPKDHDFETITKDFVSSEPNEPFPKKLEGMADNNNNNNNDNNNNDNINNGDNNASNDNNNGDNNASNDNIEYKVPPTESRKDTLKMAFFNKSAGDQQKELVNITNDGLKPEYELYLFNTFDSCICDELKSNSWYFRGKIISGSEREVLEKREATNPNCFKKIKGFNRHNVCKKLKKEAGIDMDLLEDADFKKLVGYASEGDTCGPVDPEHSEQPFSGLVNLGLTCYFNSALQSLFSNIEFRNIIYEFNQKKEEGEKVNDDATCEKVDNSDVIEKINDDDDDDDDEKMKDVEEKEEEEEGEEKRKGKESEEDRIMREKVVLELQKLFGEMEFSILSRVSPKKLVDAMGLKVGVQQDASEFYEKFVEMIFSVLSKNSKGLKERLEKCINGNIQYETVCTNCKDVSISKDVLPQVKLPICDNLNFLSGEDNDDDDDDDDFGGYTGGYGYNPSPKPKKLEDGSLTQLIQKYFSKEDIEGRRCEKCGSVCNAERTVKFTYLPDELTIGLLTFGYNIQKDISEKVIKSILIPEQLSMADYLDGESDCESEFVLSTVICHIGTTATSGHYIAYAKKYGKWWEFDDSKVSMITSLPFKLTDAAGNLVSQESADAKSSDDDESKTSYLNQWVYDFKRQRYVSKSEVNTESSVTPFMLFYRKKSVFESERSVCPKKICEDVVRVGLAKRAEIDSARTTAADIEKRANETIDEFDRLMRVVPVAPEVEDYYWIPTEWFAKYKTSILAKLSKGNKGDDCCDHKEMNCDDDDNNDDNNDNNNDNNNDDNNDVYGDEYLKVSTKEYLCPHGKLGPKKAAHMKRISAESWNLIKGKFGMVDGDPELNASSECVSCAREYGMEIREAVLSADIRINLWVKDHEWNRTTYYYVDHDFYTETFKNPYYDKGALPTEIVVNPTEKITCIHGGLKKDGEERVSPETWKWLKEHVTDDVRKVMKEFPNGTKTCAICGESVEKIKEIKKKVYNLICDFYSHKNSVPSDHRYINMGVLYYLLKKEWVEAIRNNCNDYSPQPMMETLDFNKLLCKHGYIYEDDEEMFDYYSGTHKLVSEQLWALITKL